MRLFTLILLLELLSTLAPKLAVKFGFPEHRRHAYLSAAPKLLAESLSLGEHVYGPRATLRGLEGRVVLFEVWGLGCIECRRTMPDLIELQEKYRHRGLVIIASHNQRLASERVIEYAKKEGINFTVTSFGRIHLFNRLEGMPAAYLFDPNGRMVRAGRPREIKERVIRLLDREPHWLTRGRTLGPLKEFDAKLKARPAYGEILRQLETRRGEGGEVEDEATFLIQRLRGYGRKRLRDAKRLEVGQPQRARSEYREIAAWWAGDRIADKAKTRLKDLEAEAKSAGTRNEESDTDGDGRSGAERE